MPTAQSLGPALDYWIDACQRSLLFLDILRQRGNTVQAHEATGVPHVLTFEPELVMRGRDLPRPVNYGLVRIVPPEGVTIDPASMIGPMRSGWRAAAIMVCQPA